MSVCSRMPLALSFVAAATRSSARRESGLCQRIGSNSWPELYGKQMLGD